MIPITGTVRFSVIQDVEFPEPLLGPGPNSEGERGSSVGGNSNNFQIYVNGKIMSTLPSTSYSLSDLFNAIHNFGTAGSGGGRR